MFNWTPDRLLGSLLVIFLGIPIHEWAHCWVASLLGDDTPGMQGRLTLNPFVHLDPLGTLMILTVGYGWGRAARVNPQRMHRVSNHYVAMAITAIAGPLSNVIQAMIFMIPFRLMQYGWINIDTTSTFWLIIQYAIVINISLATFNMLPIPPLDGSRVLAGIMPRQIGAFIESLEPYAMLIQVFVLFILPQTGFDIIRIMLGPMQDLALRALGFW